MIGTVKCFNIIQSDIKQFPLKFLDGRTRYYDSKCIVLF